MGPPQSEADCPPDATESLWEIKEINLRCLKCLALLLSRRSIKKSYDTSKSSSNDSDVQKLLHFKGLKLKEIDRKFFFLCYSKLNVFWRRKKKHIEIGKRSRKLLTFILPDRWWLNRMWLLQVKICFYLPQSQYSNISRRHLCWSQKETKKRLAADAIRHTTGVKYTFNGWWWSECEELMTQHLLGFRRVWMFRRKERDEKKSWH